MQGKNPMEMKLTTKISAGKLPRSFFAPGISPEIQRILPPGAFSFFGVLRLLDRNSRRKRNSDLGLHLPFPYLCRGINELPRAYTSVGS